MAVAEVDLEMDDVFGDGQDVDELMDQPLEQRNPDDEAEEVPDHGEGQTQEGEGDMEVLNRLRDLSKGAAKKRVMKPQPKLDATRLQSARGLPALTKTFEDVKFKGKGYEKDDLLKMMSTLEHWAHRLFPKTSFDDFIERLEKLGSKKAVQTTIKRIRMDMPILNEDFVGNEPEDATALVDKNDIEDGNNEPTNPEMDAEEAYEEMIRQEREEQEQQRATQQQNDDDPFKSPLGSPQRDESVRETPKTPASSTPAAGGSKSLTAEQQERMERNKRLAMEKRMKKMGITPGKSPASQVGSTSSSQPNSATKTSDTVQSTLSLGSQRPADEELAGELLRDLNQTPNKNSVKDSGATQLDLHLSESELVKEKCGESQSTEQVNQKLSASDGTDDAEKETNAENRASQNTKGLNLKLSESENTVVQSEENAEKLDLHITQSEKSSVHGSKTDQEADSSKRKAAEAAKEQLVNGHNSAEDDSILSEKSDKGSELKLKLSVSDSDNMEVDE